MSLLPEVSFPLGLVLVDLSWEEALDLVANDDPSWAAFVERVRSGAVDQEGSRKPVGVKGALGSQVACDEPSGCFDCFCWPWGSRPWLRSHLDQLH